MISQALIAFTAGDKPMKIHELVTKCANAGESSDPMGAIKQILEGLQPVIGEVARMLGFIPGVGGNARQVFYRSPQITMLKVCFPNGRRTAPHDHGTWASILLLSGEEKNTLYRRENGALRKAGEKTLTPGAVLSMRADTVHVAECIGAAPAIGLHVYGGDILELPRRMWNPDTLEEHALDWGLYETFCRIASGASSAPSP
jgi:predicted metal-dependent enzyme (double-stranded beta helix superfamily)